MSETEKKYHGRVRTMREHLAGIKAASDYSQELVARHMNWWGEVQTAANADIPAPTATPTEGTTTDGN